jgi:hypothetical protein
LGYKGAILGIGEESAWGTEATRTKAIEMSTDGLLATEERIHSNGINARWEDKDEVYQSNIVAGGDFEFETRYEGQELLLKHALGSVTTTEISSFVVSSSNKYLNMKEDSSVEIVATVDEGTYAMGEVNTETGTLCDKIQRALGANRQYTFTVDSSNQYIDFKEDAGSELNATVANGTYFASTLVTAIKTALEAAGTGTYTVTYSSTTKKFTIAVSGAITNVQLLWKTGTHGSDNTDDHIGTLIGYNDTADSANQPSHVADNVTGVSLLFTVDSSNQYIDFKEDAGSELTATVANGTYYIGENGNLEENSLCRAIQVALQAAGTGSYSADWNGITGKIQITVSGAVTGVQLLWKTGTHGSDNTDDNISSLIGFNDTADTISTSIHFGDNKIGPTYDVTFSNTTKKFTIATAGSITNVQFLWKTGLNGSDNTDDHIGSLVGYDDTADSTSSPSHVADNVVATVFQHVFKISDTILEGLTLEKQIDSALSTGKSLIYTGSRLNTLSFSVAPGELLTASANVVSKEETLEEVPTSLTLSSKPHVVFNQAVINVNSVDITNKVNSFEFTLNNDLKTDRYNLGNRNIYQPLPQSKIDVTGMLNIEWDAATYYTIFRNMTTADLDVTFTGITIKSGFNYSMKFDFNQIKLTGSSPQIADPSIVYEELPFKAYGVDSNNREVEITLQNTISSI